MKLKPFRPHPFPPKRLQQKFYSRLLNRAKRALEKYNSEVLQSPSFKLFSPHLINLESIASVESQKVKTTPKEFLLFLHSKSKKKSKLALVQDYRKALIWACKEIKKRPFSKTMICKIHKIAKRSSVAKKELGHFRSRQNWIGPSGCKIEEAYFYPPEASRVEKLMEELLLSLTKNEKEPLVQLALFFDQLLIIHPFMDGNGRVARISIPLLLYEQKAILAPFFFMSRFLLKHRLHYFQNLYTTQDTNRWEPWIAFFLREVIFEASYSLRLFKELEALQKKLKQQIPGITNKTIYFLFQNPIFFSSAFKGSKELLRSLKGSKMIQEERKGIYSFSAIFKILKNK